jgi:hypothetical protein
LYSRLVTTERGGGDVCLTPGRIVNQIALGLTGIKASTAIDLLQFSPIT